ncbi:MAG: hypothetical protein JXA41_15265 [Deltaproteobacteria bacterium]|nr:hypothetical protein [Deltaproteobacteria bacterium]
MADIFKKILYFIAVLWGVTFISFSAYADNGILFGPEVLKINFLHFHLSYHDFMIEDSAEGTLNITKNTPDKEIRGRFIVFNNKIILLSNFFLGSDISFEKTVSLKFTTRMMIFLRGTPGASITLAVKKKTDTVPPEATFSAEPSTITAGETSTLSWSTTHAETVNIEPAIGNVSLNGTHSVSPSETTIYTLVACGPGGATTKTAIVTVTIPNNSPAANQDEATTDMGKPVEINVLANDTDTDGDILTISTFSQPIGGG